MAEKSIIPFTAKEWFELVERNGVVCERRYDNVVLKGTSIDALLKFWSGSNAFLQKVCYTAYYTMFCALFRSPHL